MRNTGVAFSFGAGWPDGLRRIAFSIIPIIVLGIVLSIYFRNKDFTRLQQWAICGIVGGGFGNIIDRIFRPAGVVEQLLKKVRIKTRGPFDRLRDRKIIWRKTK